ncbi:MAG TPA: superoxide dismutase family protein [Allosphingosinicella sp.]|jgi:Cu-Zn family superoxide dismutase
MKLLTIGCVGAVAALAAGCAPSGTADSAGSSAGAAAASAEVRDAAGQGKARVQARQVGDAVRVRVEATGMAVGTYAAHVHTTGVCAPPDFTSAGPHWNPTNQQHGKDNPAGMHKGDLPNLTIGANGRGSIEYAIPAASIRGGATPMLDGDGAALVIHAQADDYRTDPSGNAGARVACGVFG